MNELSLFNTLFDNAFDTDMLPEFNFHATCASPKVDVKESKDKYTLEMDLPGRTEKDVNIEFDLIKEQSLKTAKSKIHMCVKTFSAWIFVKVQRWKLQP